MAQEFTVRLLGPADAALLRAAGDAVFDAAPVPALVDEFLGDPRHHLVAAIADGTIIGFASGVHYVHPDKPAQMFINEAGTDEAWQRRGVGRAVMAALVDHARNIGCTEAWVLTDADNDAARGLYAAAGGDEFDAGRIFVIDLNRGEA